MEERCVDGHMEGMSVVECLEGLYVVGRWAGKYVVGHRTHGKEVNEW